MGLPVVSRAERPQLTPDDWTELLTTMLPQPVRTNPAGALLAGDPVLVIVRVDATALHIMHPDVRRDAQNNRVVISREFATVPLGTAAARVAELIRVAWGERISRYVWCPRCHRSSEPEDHYPGELCDPCTEL